MLDVITRKNETKTIEARAWRVEFVDKATAVAEGVETIEIDEPRPATAVLHPFDASEALAQVEPHTGDAFVLVWLPPGANSPPAIERDAEEWMRNGGGARREANVRADVRTVRLVWDEGRALIYSSHGDMRFAIDAVVRFTAAQREAAALEANLKSAWPSIEADAPLTHSVRARQQRMQKHVNEMTVRVARMNTAWLRIANALEQLDSRLAEPSKRLFAELVSAVSLYERMEMLEDPIEFAADQYELANTRLIDAKLVRKERMNAIVGYLFEAAIIALLGYQILRFH